MGSDEISTSLFSYTKIFNDVFPMYLAYGMSYDEFWNSPNFELTQYYREAHEVKVKEENYMMWLQGIYFANAINATIGNMLSKNNKIEYPSEPIAITKEEMKIQKERQEKTKMEKAKAQFIKIALGINANMKGG